MGIAALPGGCTNLEQAGPGPDTTQTLITIAAGDLFLPIATKQSFAGLSHLHISLQLPHPSTIRNHEI
jgi:hypothetical protein